MAIQSHKPGHERRSVFDPEVALQVRATNEAARAGMQPETVDQSKDKLDSKIAAGNKYLSGALPSQVDTSPINQELADEVFKANGKANPYHAETTEALLTKIKDVPQFKYALAHAEEYLANPTEANKAEFIKSMEALTEVYPHGNVSEVLFLIFREAIRQTSEDKKYFLLRLQQYNAMGERISQYLSTLVDHSQDLGKKSAESEHPEMELTSQPVEIVTWDLSSLSPEGELLAMNTEAKYLNREGLNDLIKTVESTQETIRNRRQLATTAFENFDQKSNQLYNLMSSVLKSMIDQKSAVIRNMQ